MFLLKLSKFAIRSACKEQALSVTRKCHGVLGIKHLIQTEKLDHIRLERLAPDERELAMNLLKQYYLKEHVFVQTRNMELNEDKALDEYLNNVLKQGNSLFAKTEDGRIAGICASFASSRVDPINLRNYAFYRQDPNVKDFLYLIAKLEETPNLWNLYKQEKIFEIRMLAVLPDFRRLGLSVMLVERCKELAYDLGYHVCRMDCINPYDYKIAERCQFKLVVKYPLHKLRGPRAVLVPRPPRPASPPDSPLPPDTPRGGARSVRVYAHARAPLTASPVDPSMLD